MEEEVREGLTAHPKVLPPKYFYDAHGSELFERITRLPEYYPTRAETEILETHAQAILAEVRANELVEIGSGSSRKTRLLIEAMHAVGGRRYVAFDVSEDALAAAAEALSDDYPWLEIHGVVGDFEHPFRAPQRNGRRLVIFLGSTIGNLEREERTSFLRRVGALLEAPGDRFLLGVDLVKPAAILEAAYDDASGVTAQFNLNVLRVINRELHGELPLDAFVHRATWVPERARMEMFLVATRPVEARIGALDLVVTFEEGEALRTEISCKFTRPSITEELREAGFELERWLTDARGRFGLLLARRTH